MEHERLRPSRRLGRRSLLQGLVSGGVIAAQAAPAWSAVPPPPSSLLEVSASNVAYDALQLLVESGFDAGLPPEGTLGGKPGYTRYQFGLFTSHLAGSTEYAVQVGWPQTPGKTWRSIHSPLHRLAEEFDVELRYLTAEGMLDRGRFRDAVDRFDRLWRDGRPQGVRSPLIGSAYRSFDPKTIDAGRKAAENEWRQGVVALDLFSDAVAMRRIPWRESASPATTPRSGGGCGSTAPRRHRA
jgi:hypothetical protein